MNAAGVGQQLTFSCTSPSSERVSVLKTNDKVVLVIAGVLLASASLLSAAADIAIGASEELTKLYNDDQADRIFRPGQTTDWEAIGIRDEQREMRVKQLLAAGSLGSGTDYYHAAMVLQHASSPDDFLLAHDLCIIAISKGEGKAKWLAAASIDRFLVSIGRPQRFGTQFQSKKSFRPPMLVVVDPSVPDSLRKELDVPTLEEAKKKEAEMVSWFNDTRKAKK
jgi:hypothetical protein